MRCPTTRPAVGSPSRCDPESGVVPGLGIVVVALLAARISRRRRQPRLYSRRPCDIPNAISGVEANRSPKAVNPSRAAAPGAGARRRRRWPQGSRACAGREARPRGRSPQAPWSASAPGSGPCPSPAAGPSRTSLRCRAHGTRRSRGSAGRARLPPPGSRSLGPTRQARRRGRARSRSRRRRRHGAGRARAAG